MTDTTMRQNEVLVGTGRLRYWEGGPPDAPTILLLHSAFSDAPFSWAPIWERLAATHRVIAPDMPGFGASQAPANINLGILAGALGELMALLGVTRATVVGNSFGVSAGISLAGLYPALVDRLVFVNGVMLPPVSPLVRRATAIPLFDHLISGMFYRSVFSRPAIHGSFPHASAADLTGIFAQIDRDGPANFRTVKACALNSAPANPAIKAPVTLLWGADDRLTPIRMARDLVRTLPGAELIPIDRAGHLPQRDRPQEFVARLLQAMGRR